MERQGFICIFFRKQKQNQPNKKGQERFPVTNSQRAFTLKTTKEVDESVLCMFNSVTSYHVEISLVTVPFHLFPWLFFHVYIQC